MSFMSEGTARHIIQEIENTINKEVEKNRSNQAVLDTLESVRKKVQRMASHYDESWAVLGFPRKSADK